MKRGLPWLLFTGTDVQHRSSLIGGFCPHHYSSHTPLCVLLQDEYSTVSMQVPTMTTEGNHEVRPADERGPCSSRLSDMVACASNVLQRYAVCTPAGRTAQPLCSSSRAHCAGRRTMLEQHQLQVQSFCLRVTPQSRACLQTDWPGLRPAGASDRFKNTATDSGGSSRNITKRLKVQHVQPSAGAKIS